MDTLELQAAHLNRLYITYRREYGICFGDHMYCIPRWGNRSYRRLTDAVLYGHLRHRYSVNVFCGSVITKFLCFEVRSDDLHISRTIMRELEALGIPHDRIYISRCGDVGFHIEIFFQEVVRYIAMLRVYFRVLDNAGLYDLDDSVIFFRPWDFLGVSLPLSISPVTKRLRCYVDRDTFEPIADEAYIASIQTIDLRDYPHLFSEALFLREMQKCV